MKNGLSDNVMQFINFGDLRQSGGKDERNQEDILDFGFLQAYARKVKANEKNMGHGNADDDAEKKYEL